MANRYWKIPKSSGKSSGKGQNFDKVLGAMIKDADQMLTKLVAQKDYQDRTGNLISSYAYAIFYNGEIVKTNKSTDVSIGPNKGMTASDEIDKEIKRRLALADKNKLTLVVFAAMFYGGILESGANTKRKYMVVKDIIRDDISAMANAYNGQLKEYG